MEKLKILTENERLAADRLCRAIAGAIQVDTVSGPVNPGLRVSHEDEGFAALAGYRAAKMETDSEFQVIAKMETDAINQLPRCADETNRRGKIT